MAILPPIINPGAPIHSSIPLAEKTLGKGFGFNFQSSSSKKESEEVLIDLTTSAQRRNSKSIGASARSSISANPLGQALDALSELAKGIESLQKKYLQAGIGSANSTNISSELNALAREYKRITDSDIFKSTSSETNSDSQGSLAFGDSGIKAVLSGGDSTRIESLKNSLKGLTEISFDDILNDQTISKNIKDFIADIRTALNPTSKAAQLRPSETEKSDSILISVPQARIQSSGVSEGLGVSLLSFSNEDLIKAVAAHVDISATNVLILTFNPTEPETEKEKKEREEKEQKVEILNPSGAAATE